MELLRPKTRDEALHHLADSDEDTKVIAGGTAIMLMIRNGLLFPSSLVSLERVAAMDSVVVGDDHVRIGALATLRSLERNIDLHRSLPTLAATFGLVANHRVRQRATIGGNLSESDYASDPPAVLTTLGCQVRIASTAQERILSLPDFLVSYYETALEPEELVTEVVVRRPPPTARTTYVKYLSRAAEDRPCVGVAAYLDTDESGRCSDLRIAVAGATATPFTVTDVMDDVRGHIVDGSTWREVAKHTAERIDPIADARGSAAYRQHIVEVLVGRCLEAVSAPGENGAERW